MIEMSVVRGLGGVCDMCMCLARGGVGGVGVRGLGLGFTNPRGTGGKWDMCVFWLWLCGLVLRGWGSGFGGLARVWEGRVVLSLCLLCVWIFCVDGRSSYPYIVLGGYHVQSLVHPVFNLVAPYRYLLPNLYLSVANIANPDFNCLCLVVEPGLVSTIARFSEEDASHPAGPHDRQSL